MIEHDTTPLQDIEASNAVPSRHPSWKPEPLPKLALDAAKLVRPPRKVQQALSNFPKGRPVSIDEFIRQKLRLPYGRWITDDGADVLFNREYEMLFIWPTGAEKPERCDPNWGDVTVQEGRFYSDDSAPVIGTSKLHHALETLLDAGERGDRAAADVLEEWLLGKHLSYREITRAYWEDVAQYRAERELLEDILYGPSSPAKPA
jgi:hypothetical protein